MRLLSGSSPACLVDSRAASGLWQPGGSGRNTHQRTLLLRLPWALLIVLWLSAHCQKYLFRVHTQLVLVDAVIWTKGVWAYLKQQQQQTKLIYYLHTIKSVVKGINPMASGTWTELYNHPHNPILEHFQHPHLQSLSTIPTHPRQHQANTNLTSCLSWFAFFGHTVWFHSYEVSR